MFDFYEIKETLGKGKFGLVKSGVHKKTGKKVAVKIMTKKEMTVQDVEL
jgi:serine/threonine protein kinase